MEKTILKVLSNFVDCKITNINNINKVVEIIMEYSNKNLKITAENEGWESVEVDISEVVSSNIKKIVEVL